MNLIDLKAEIDSDPLTRGYSGMTDQQVADSLNDTVDRSVPAGALHGDVIYNVATDADFDLLSSEKKDRWTMFTRSDSIDLQNGANQHMVNHIFGNPSDSRTAMIALSTVLVSRAMEPVHGPGSDRVLGNVRRGNVESARAL